MLVYKITFASQSLAAFRPVPQSCTSSTLLPHTTKIVSSYATLSATFIFKQALKFDLNTPAQNQQIFIVYLSYPQKEGVSNQLDLIHPQCIARVLGGQT